MNTQRTSAFLMANLGSEVSRILSAKEHGNEVQIRSSFERATRILTEILTLPDMKTRSVEIQALSDLISDITSPKPILQVSRKNISAYFIPFATRVMGPTMF